MADRNNGQGQKRLRSAKVPPVAEERFADERAAHSETETPRLRHYDIPMHKRIVRMDVGVGKACCRSRFQPGTAQADFCFARLA